MDEKTPGQIIAERIRSIELETTQVAFVILRELAVLAQQFPLNARDRQEIARALEVRRTKLREGVLDDSNGRMAMLDDQIQLVHDGLALAAE